MATKPKNAPIAKAAIKAAQGKTAPKKKEKMLKSLTQLPSDTAKEAPAPKPEAKPKVPRIPPFVNGEPVLEKSRVPLTDAEFNDRTQLMLEMIREHADLLSESDASKANYKHRLKSKTEEITKIQSIMAARAEEVEVAVYWRYFPKKKIKRKYIASSGKPLGQALPMTPDEVKRHMQPDLLTIPPAAKPVPEPQAATATTVPFPDAIGQGPGGEQIPPPKETTVELDEDDEVPEGSEEFTPED